MVLYHLTSMQILKLSSMIWQVMSEALTGLWSLMKTEYYKE